MFPGPRLGHLVIAERRKRGRDRPLPPRRAQPHVHLVKPSRRGRRGHGRQQRLRQARVIGARRQRPGAVRRLDPARVVDHDQVQVRLRVQVPRAKRPHPQHHGAAPGRRAVPGREVPPDHPRQGADRGIGDIGVLHRRLVRADEAAQVVDADAELPFVRPAARGVQRDLVSARRLRQDRAKLVRQRSAQTLRARPRREEMPGEDRVQNLRVAGKIGGEPRHRAADVGQKVDQLRVRPEQRKQLHPGGQAAQEAVEPRQRLVGMGRAAHAGKDLRLDSGKDFLRAARAERGVGAPSFDHRRRFRRHRRQIGVVRLARAGIEEVARQIVDPAQPRLDFRGPGGRIVGCVQRRDLGEGRSRVRQHMRLAVVDHLHAMLDPPVGAVADGQIVRDRLRDPALGRQRGQRRHGRAVAQVGIAPARDQLAGLRKELDVADAALAQLHVVAHRADRPVQPLVAADAPPHVVGVLHGREVERAAPDERAKVAQEPRPGRKVAGADPRLDVGRAFPAAPLRLVIGQRGRGRDADRRDRGVGAQPQVGAKDVAVFGEVRQN